MPDVIIVGAGITGLSCAWRLKRLGIDALVLESSERPGGVIQSERWGDYLIERGPNSLLPSAANFPLLDESGLSKELIEGDPRAPRYVCIGRRLRKVPFGVMSARGFLRLAAEPFVRQGSQPDESVHDFFVRRLGREAEQRLVSPFVTGIYAGNTRELSMAATFPKLAALESRFGSLVVGMLKSRKGKGARRGRTCSFAAGMETLPRRLAEDCRIVFNVESVTVGPDLRVTWTGGEAQPKAIVITAPAYRAVTIIGSLLPRAAEILSRMDYAPMVIATVSLPDSAFQRPLRGFGFLVPRTEESHVLGTLFSSALFPGRAPKGRQLLTAFLGGALEPEVLHWPDGQVWDVVRSELKTILKTSEKPEPLRIVRRTHAIPQYKIGHERLVGNLMNEVRSIPGLFVAGNYLEGVSVAACMEAGESIARQVKSFCG